VTGVYVRVASELARAFTEVQAVRLARATAFRSAVDAALVFMAEAELVAEVIVGGSLRGAVNPYGALIARVRLVPELARERARLADEQAEAKRWRQVDKAAHRGGTLRAFVDRGVLSAEEAAEQLGADFSDDADLLAIARAALTGGPQ
jgi:hypothetical protein